MSVMPSVHHILCYKRQSVYLFHLQNSMRHGEVLSKMDINIYLIET